MLSKSRKVLLLNSSFEPITVVSIKKAILMYFLDKVDASAVFHNTYTRFNDGFELGLGDEVAVSTDKLHARGPMGINDLMTYKWVVLGQGQVRT